MHRSLLGVVTASLLLAPADSYQAKEETVTCTRVIDGDTIEVSITGTVEKVRLIGVDTPETVDPRKPVEAFGKEASEFTRKLVDGKKVVLQDELGGQDRDKYHRLLRYVYLEDGTFVNAEIIKQGYGHAYVVFPFSHMEEFRTYERQAREKGLGLWGSTETKVEPGKARAPTEGPFVGSSQSNKYHRPDCVWAHKINPANLVTFKSPEEAQSHGYVPCKVCNPNTRPVGHAPDEATTYGNVARAGHGKTESESIGSGEAGTTAPGDATVYVTKTGTKYHRAGCRYLSKSAVPMPLKDAAKRYAPCSVCRPPLPQSGKAVHIPMDGELLREQSKPEVYVIYDGKKIWIPTLDALFIMDHSWADVQVVPDGSLASLPEVKIDSASPTPGSLVFPPQNDPNPPDYGRHFAIKGVSTSIRVVSQGKEVRVIELRGWLYPDEAVTNTEGGWDDWHYYLEVDSAWAAEQGIDLNQVLKIGNIIINEGYAIDKGSPDAYRSCSLPRIGLEINGWKPGNTRGVAKPSDWKFPQDGTAEGQEFISSPKGQEYANTRWPYDPRIPVGGLNEEGTAPYVRVVGSLIADKPHSGGATDAWRGGRTQEEEANPARHTEIHPPDRIQVLPYQGRKGTLRGIAVVAANGPFDRAEQEINVHITPPGPRPSALHRAAIVEMVGPETNFSTIVEGNAFRNGARLTNTDDGVDVYVKVARTGLWGAPGKFKALYRVFWEAGSPPPLTWSFKDQGWFQTNDHDFIQYTIERGVVHQDVVEFVLTLGPGVTWKKIINVPDGEGSSWDIVAEGEGGSGSNGLWAYQVRNGQLLTFKKGKVFGLIQEVYKLDDLGGLTPGSRVTFRWVKD